MKNLFITIVFLLMVTIAQSQQILTLHTIFETIEKNNPLLQSYKNKIKSDSALTYSAKAWDAPMIGFEFDQNHYSLTGFHDGVFRASIMQDFPNGKVIDAKTKYLQSLSKINLNESEHQKNILFTEAKEAYNGIYLSQRKIRIVKESIATLQSMIELSEKEMASGNGELASIFKLKARLADKSTMLIHEENMIKAYMATINYLMNADMNQTFLIDTSVAIKNYRNLKLINSKDSIELIRSDIHQMNSKINSMKLNQNLMSLGSKLTFGMKAEHFAMVNNPDMFSIMGTVKIPIVPWSSKGYKSEVNAMKFNISSMEQEKQNMVNMALQMVKMLVIEMDSEYQELDNYMNNIIPAYKKSFDAYLLAYSQNTSDLFMVLMAFDDLQMAQMEYIYHIGVLLKIQVDYEKELQIR